MWGHSKADRPQPSLNEMSQRADKFKTSASAEASTLARYTQEEAARSAKADSLRRSVTAPTERTYTPESIPSARNTVHDSLPRSRTMAGTNIRTFERSLKPQRNIGSKVLHYTMVKPLLYLYKKILQ